LITAVALALAAAILIAIGFFIFKAKRFGREHLAEDAGYTEERRSVLSPSQIWRGLLRWLRSILSRSTDTVAEAVRATRRRIVGAPYPSDPVRQTYTRMLRRASALGLRRSPGATPREFLVRLAAHWPEGEEDFALLTEAYDVRRYGDVPASEEEVRDLRARWQTLRHVMRSRPTFQRPARDASPAIE